MDRLRGIEYFVSAAELGSISAAADALGVSPPAVSKLLAALESRLRIPLFTRTRRGIVLTRDGEGYLARCRKILEDIESAEAALTIPAQSPRGTLVVGMPPNLATYCIAPALHRFRGRFPEIIIHLRRAYRDSDLAAQGLDVLLALAWLGKDDLIASRLAQTRSPQVPADLATHDCLVYRIPEAIVLDKWTFARGEERSAVQLRPKAVCDEQGWLITAALNGAGVVRAIDLTVQHHLERGELVPALLDWEGCLFNSCAIYFSSSSRDGCHEPTVRQGSRRNPSGGGEGPLIRQVVRTTVDKPFARCEQRRTRDRNGRGKISGCHPGYDEFANVVAHSASAK